MSDFTLLNALKKGSDSPYFVCVVAVNPFGEVLLGERREDGIWTMPGGGANLGETPEDAVLREAWEEANLIIDRARLEPMGVKLTPRGMAIHCFLYRTDQTKTSSASDPDREVKEWKWTHPSNFPKALSTKRNANRLQTINEAMMKYHGMKKSEELKTEDYESLDAVLKASERRMHPDGSEWENKDGAWVRVKNASGTKREEHEKDIARMHREISRFKGKVAEGENYRAFLSQMSPEKLKKFHGKVVQEHTLEPDIEKSVTQMGGAHGDPDINTSSFAVENNLADPEWLEKISRGMEDFGFGDVPREFNLDQGVLHLVKVDDGMYSGYFRKRELGTNDGIEYGLMEDSARVRIERQTIPSLVNFLTAKEWIGRKAAKPEAAPQSAPIMPAPTPQPVVEPALNQKLRMLELLDKLLT